MDNKNPQTGGAPLKEGHDTSEPSIQGILWFGALLVVGGILSFVSMRYFQKGLQWWEETHEAKMTPMEQQLYTQREPVKPESKEASANDDTNTPEVYGPGKDRKQMEAHLRETFPAPRLQYDDEHDMKIFRDSEDAWLKSTGKDANGNIHIPVDRAIDLLAQRGLPAVSGPWQPPTLPTAVPMVPMQSAAKK